MKNSKFLDMITEEFMSKDVHQITGATALVGTILKIFPAQEYRVDVLMDHFGHTSRTILADSDFADNLFDTLNYAIDNSSATHYTVSQRPVNRNGAFVNQCTIVLN
jgi:hypothetical protein